MPTPEQEAYYERLRQQELARAEAERKRLEAERHAELERKRREVEAAMKKFK